MSRARRWLCGLAAAAIATSAAPETITLQAALAEAAAHAPALRMGRARAATRRAEVASAAALPATELSAEGGVDEPRWTAGLSQRLPTASRGARVDAASQSARAAELEADQAAAEARASARRAYFALVRDQELLQLSGRQLEIASQGEAAARARFQSGAAPRLDAVQAGLARSTAEVERASREAERDASSAELAVLLGRDPARLLEAATAPAPGLPPLDAVLSRAGAGPAARARDADVRAAERQLDAARLERLPSATIGASVEPFQASGAEASPPPALGLRGTVQLELPLLGLNQGEIGAASARVGEATLQRELTSRERAAQVLAAHRRLARSLAAVQRYDKEILPAAAEAEQMALEAYRAGRAPLASLLEAQRAGAETRQKAAEAGFDAQDALAQLETAAGVPLDAP
jgi:outer membrane protein TolC